MSTSIHIPHVLAVFPVLVGPLQTLLALLPAILVSVASMALAIFKPGGFVKLMRFCWRQKLFFGSLAGLAFAWQNVSLLPLQARHPEDNRVDGAHSTWEVARGGSLRQGRGPGRDDAIVPDTVWRNARDNAILSSPAITGGRVIYSTATDIGPFSPEGRGAIVCVDAHTGGEVWRYAPDKYRATFSSPVVSGQLVVCGEGLHQVEDARVSCLDLASGNRLWEFRTHSHVESTPALTDECVYFGAGSDGFYCLWNEPDLKGKSRVRWHLPAAEFADCESSPVIDQGVVYFGLGEGGAAICAVRADTGELIWKLDTPYPVFAPPTVADGKLFIATGNGNYVQSASDLLEMKMQVLRDDGATEEQLVETRSRFKPAAEVWCIDLASRVVQWKFTTQDAILGALAYSKSPNGQSDEIYFTSRDGHVYRISARGELLAKYDLHEPLISSPALGWSHIYTTTASGRLICHDQSSLKPVWDCSLGSGTTFTSSPTLAHGHVYVGTAQSGITCIGRPGIPKAPIWSGTPPHQVARADLTVQGLHKQWEYPPAGTAEFVVTAPLMPFAGELFAAGGRENQPELVRLNMETVEAGPREIWTKQFRAPIVASPIGYGDRICVLEGATQLHCLAVASGETLWSRALGNFSVSHPKAKETAQSPGIALSTSHVFAWTGQSQLGCFELSTGEPVWDESHSPANSQSGTSGWGVPIFESDLLISIRQRNRSNSTSPGLPTILTAQDSSTGTPLWQVEIASTPAGRPTLAGHEILIPLKDNRTGVYRIIDGGFIRTEADQQATHSAGDNESSATQIIAIGRHVVTTSESGGIVCWGATEP